MAVIELIKKTVWNSQSHFCPTCITQNLGSVKDLNNRVNHAFITIHLPVTANEETSWSHLFRLMKRKNKKNSKIIVRSTNELPQFWLLIWNLMLFIQPRTFVFTFVPLCQYLKRKQWGTTWIVSWCKEMMELRKLLKKSPYLEGWRRGYCKIWYMNQHWEWHSLFHVDERKYWLTSPIQYIDPAQTLNSPIQWAQTTNYFRPITYRFLLYRVRSFQIPHGRE